MHDSLSSDSGDGSDASQAARTVVAEMERQFSAGKTPIVEQWLERDPQLAANRSTTLWLVEQEARLRRRHVGTIDEVAFRRRFGELWTEVAARLADEDCRLADDTHPSIRGYQIVRLIGSGGFGRVYLAKQTALGRLVALKVLAAVDDTQLEQRFVGEAAVLGKLADARVVQVYEAGLSHDGRPYVAMEFVAGGNLRERIRNARFTPLEAAALVREIALGVAQLHRQGVIHRDLKPENILLTDDGQPKIADFGLAKYVESSMRLTQTGEILGTLLYAAPEQLLGYSAKVDPRADVYSLGVILYELLSGKRPYEADGIGTLVGKLRTELPAPLSKENPRDLETICLKCLRMNPTERYGSAQELASDLERFQFGSRIVGRRPGVVRRGIDFAKRRPRAALLACLAVSAFVSAVWATGYWVAYVRLTVEHYLTIVDRWGVPAGVTRLDSSTLRHRDYAFRFTKRGLCGPVVSLEIVDAAGRLTPFSEFYLWGIAHAYDADPMAIDYYRPCRLDYAYLGDHPKTLKAFNHLGVQLYSAELTYDALHAGDIRQSGIVRIVPSTLERIPNVDFNKGTAKFDGWTAVRFSCTPEGWGKSHDYYDEQMQPFNIAPNDEDNSLPNAPNVVGYDYSDFNEFGQPRRLIARDRFGAKPSGHQSCEMQLEYETNGLPKTVIHLNAVGRPISDLAQGTVNYDAWLRRESVVAESYDESKKSYSVTGILKFEYDDNGGLKELALLGPSGEPFSTGEGYSRITRTIEEDGKSVVVRFFDTKGPFVRKCADGCGHHADADEIRLRYDDQGRLERERYFRQGHLQLTVSYGFDAAGRFQSVTYRDGHGRPRPSPMAADLKVAYDEKRDIAGYSYENLAVSLAAARIELALSRQVDGAVITRRLFDAAGRPTHWGNQEHTQVYSFTEEGEFRRFAARDLSVAYLNEVHSMYEGNVDDLASFEGLFSRGRLVESTALDRHGRRIRNKDGFDCLRFRYTDDGQITKIRSGFDEAKFGYGFTEERLDVAGRTIGGAWYWNDGTKAVVEDGRTEVEFSYHPDGTAKRTARGFDETQFGISYLEESLDQKMRVVGVVCYGADGRPAPSRDGFTRSETVHHDDGSWESRQRDFADASGVTFGKRTFRPNPAILEQTFYDADEQPAKHRVFGFARLRETNAGIELFDESGHKLKTAVRVDWTFPRQLGEQMGLKRGDVIVTYDGKPIAVAGDLASVVAQETTVGWKPKDLVILRDGRRTTLSKPHPGRLGVTLSVFASAES